VERWDGRRWTLLPSVPQVALGAVSCVSATRCTAVGFNGNGPVADVLRGATQSIKAMADPGGEPGSGNFPGLSCASATACVAVGSFYPTSGGETAPLVERLIRGTWSIEATPPASASGDLNAISCVTGGGCTAVGEFAATAAQVTWALHWNGATWTSQFPPDQGIPAAATLNAVSCASTMSCTAVGQYTGLAGVQPLAVGWDGSRWSLQSAAAVAGSSGSELNGVACTAPSSCIAVGSGRGGPLAERWNGVSWTILPTPGLPTGAVPGGGSLAAVSCTSAVACTAVGQVMVAAGVAPLAERWNGAAWALQSVPNPGPGSNQLNGVSCASAAACTAVGAFTSGGRSLISQPLAMAWNGVAWSTQAAPSPTGSGVFSGVSCSTPSACEAVGRNYTNYGPPPPLADGWNGTSWSAQPIPGPHPPYPIPGTDPELNGVSCVTADACAAVGGALTIGAFNGRPLAFIFNGVAWGAQTLPNVAGATNAYLNGISCLPAGVCEAVGSAVVGSGSTGRVSEPLAYRLSG
jgi:hypothetical protein